MIYDYDYDSYDLQLSSGLEKYYMIIWLSVWKTQLSIFQPRGNAWV